MKVRSVTRVILDTPVPVYDLSVDGTENFKLHDGPFVHNSKDVSDALAGVVYGLTMRRESWLNAGISLGAIPDHVKETLIKTKNLKTSPDGA